MSYIDFNRLEVAAERLITSGDFAAALTIYFYMADGDPSLDGGHLAERIGTCYERIGDVAAARYWLHRAVEENPELYANCSERADAMGQPNIQSLLVERPE